jgi:hypothetical protein
MTKKHDGDKESTITHGGFRWSKPAELKQVRISITLSPQAIQLLEPYTRTGQRSKIIDVAVKEFLEKKGKYS